MRFVWTKWRKSFTNRRCIVCRNLLSVFASIMFMTIPSSRAGTLGCNVWTKFATPHFRLYTDSSPDQAPRMLRALELAHSFFRTTEWSNLLSDQPVQIVVFAGPEEYTSYRRNPQAFAYFRRLRAQNFIVVQDFSLDSDRVAIHEYTHCVLTQVAPNLPLWLQEGLAEVYSSLTTVANRASIGAELAQYSEILHHSSHDLKLLFGADDKSASYTRAKEIKSFYAESWALAHMLLLGPGYRNTFADFLSDLADGETIPDALQKAFGVDVDTLRAALRDYVAAARIEAVSYPCSTCNLLTLTISRTHPQEEEVAILLASLASPGTSEAFALRSSLTNLAGRSDSTPAVLQFLGYTAMDDKNFGQAGMYFKVAIERGLKDADTLCAFARAKYELGAGDDEVAPILRQALELQPQSVRTRLELARKAAELGSYRVAIDALAEGDFHTERECFERGYLKTYCFLELRKFREAAQSGYYARSLARVPEQRRRINELLLYLHSDG